MRFWFPLLTALAMAPPRQRKGLFRRPTGPRGAALAGLLALGACSSLPHDGPTGGAFGKADAVDKRAYALVNLDYRAAEQVAASPPPTLASLASAASDAPNDRLGEGDVLAVTIFEAGGAALFSASGDGAGLSGGGAEALPHLTVARDGSVTIPFAGPVRVAGLTVAEAAAVIQGALRGRAVNPQVQVALAGNVSNTVTVLGDVRTVGRVPLSVNSERLLDILALSGGPTRPPGDISVTIARGDTAVSAPLAAVLRDPAQNIRLASRDQVRLLYAPRKYSTFGALGRVAEQQIEDERLSLAEALSKTGGLDPLTANGAAVFLFRFERPEVASALGVRRAASPKGVPIVYRLNLMKPDGFFVADKFDVQAGDMIYVPRSDATELRKFLDLVSVISQVTYNLTVTPVLH
jgi:polysaccharide export outer membrane protein